MTVFANDPIIICPKCQAEIRLTESLAAPILAEAQRGFEDKLAEQQSELQKRTQESRDLSVAIRKREEELDAEVEARLRSVRQEISAVEAKKAQLVLGEQIQVRQEQIAELERIVAERDEKLAEARKRDQESRELAEAIRKREEELDAEVEARLGVERQTIAKAESKKAQLALDVQLKSRQEQIVELERVVAERDERLKEARTAQAELKRKERKLEEARAELELSVETRVSESLVALRATAVKEAEGKLKLKITEKDETIASMLRQIEDLRRKSEQGSQQLQGEAQEIELENILRTKFPGDIIEPVSKGIAGGDVLQRVLGLKGQTCGTIIWESKRTKSWSEGWLTKLRNDQRASNADAAILVSEALPKGLETFELRNDVWVAEFRCIVPVATAIRHALIEVSSTRKAEEGQQTKMEMVYRYLTGQRFRQRISAIVDQFSEMQGDLDRERRAATRLWAKRESQIRGVIESTVGMYGDLQGIAGRSLQDIEGLDHILPPEPKKLKS
jgi:hypothetical protein